MIKRVLMKVAMLMVVTGILFNVHPAVAQQQCSAEEDWLALNNQIAAVPESEREAIFESFSPVCQDLYMRGLELAPGYTSETVTTQESTIVPSGNAESLAATTCRTETFTKTKNSTFGFVAYKFHAHYYRCFDGAKLIGTPSMWTTFSQVDHFMQIQDYTSQNDRWNPRPTRYNVYEQRQIRNCIWSGCIGTFYPSSSGYMMGSGFLYHETRAG